MCDKDPQGPIQISFIYTVEPVRYGNLSNVEIVQFPSSSGLSQYITCLRRNLSNVDKEWFFGVNGKKLFRVEFAYILE